MGDIMDWYIGDGNTNTRCYRGCHLKKIPFFMCEHLKFYWEIGTGLEFRMVGLRFSYTYYPTWKPVPQLRGVLTWPLVYRNQSYLHSNTTRYLYAFKKYAWIRYVPEDHKSWRHLDLRSGDYLTWNWTLITCIKK